MQVAPFLQGTVSHSSISGSEKHSQRRGRGKKCWKLNIYFIYKKKRKKKKVRFLFTLVATFTREAWRACTHVVSLGFCRRWQSETVVDCNGARWNRGSHRAHASILSRLVRRFSGILIRRLLDGACCSVLARHRSARMFHDLAASAREALGTSAAKLFPAYMMTRPAEQARLVSSAVI